MLLAAAIACSGDAPPTPPSPTAPSQLIVQIGGLPLNAAIAQERSRLLDAGFGARLRGPNGLDTLLLQDGTLRNLPAGTYILSTPSATIDSVAYAPVALNDTIALADGATRVVSVSFAPTTGGLDLRVGNAALANEPVSLVLDHPDGRQDSLVMPVRVALLSPGQYVLHPQSIVRQGSRFAPVREVDTVQVAAGPTAAVIALSYREERASLQLDIAGVPTADRLGFVTLTASDGAQRTLRATGDTLVFDNLLAGTYFVMAQVFSVSGARYEPLLAVDTVNIPAGERRVRPLEYRRLVASLRVLVSNLPAGANGDVTVAGPNGFRQALTRSTVLPELTPGAYTITANAIAHDSSTYAPAIPSLVVTVALGEPQEREVRYALASGGLAVTITGLPDSIPADIVVRGPPGTSLAGFPWSLNRSAARRNLPPGSYTVEATTRLVGGSLYIPSPAQRTVTVLPSLAPASVSVTYVETVGPTLDFAIDAAYLTQAVQRLDGGVSLVASRDALLRVFVRASEGNGESLTVRIRLFQGNALYRTLLIPSPGASAPLGVNEGLLAQSWNVEILGGDVRTGMSFVADFGEAPGVSDARPENNRWPVVGAQTVDVQTVPPFAITLVPVHHPLDGLTGNVSTDSAAALFAFTRSLMPLERVTLAVHAPFTTSAPPLQANDSNNGWTMLLIEMDALRLLENAGSTHYAGIVGTSYPAGIAGIATIGGRNLVSWDKPFSVRRVLAHELGHNFGRYHSPGCGAGFIDGSYPYAAGATGVWGWNGTALISPTVTNDIMGYCTAQWISDYTWHGVLNFRNANGAQGFRAPAMSPASRPAGERDSVLLLWGAIRGDQAELYPAVQAAADVSWPAIGRGRYTLELLDASGRVQQQVRFDGEQVDHPQAGSPDARTFAFTIPTRGLRAPVAALRLRRGAVELAYRRATSGALAPGSRPDSSATSRSSATPEALTPPQMRSRRLSAARVALEWDSAAWPLALVRDASTGAVLAFARESGRPLAVGARDSVTITFSDGVRSVTQRRRLR